MLAKFGVRLHKGINNHTGVRNTRNTPELSDAIEEMKKNFDGKSIRGRIANIRPSKDDARFLELEVVNMTLDPKVFQSIFFDYAKFAPKQEDKPKRGRKQKIIVTVKVTRIIFFEPEN